MSVAVVWEHWDRIVDGAWVTAQLTAVSLAMGLLAAVALAAMRVARHPLLRWPAYAYIFYFRGTPLLVQLFLVYYGSGQFRPELQEVVIWRYLDAAGDQVQITLWDYFRDAWFCAVLTLTLNTSAYTAEILRGALQAVARGQIEAARAAGMSRALLARRIVAPQALRIALPMYGNEVVFLLQATSLVSTITILDLTGVAQRIIAKTFAVYEVYIAVAVFYLVLSYSLILLFKGLERRWSRGKVG